MNLEDTLKDLISDMTVNPAAPTDAVERQAVYLDRSETTDARWKALMTFQFHNIVSPFKFSIINPHMRGKYQ